MGMHEKQLMVIWIIVMCLYPLEGNSDSFSDTLLPKIQKNRPFWGDHYKNIKWIMHLPDVPSKSDEREEIYPGQTDIGKLDLDKDFRDETIKVIWGAGASDHSLKIEIYKGDEVKVLLAKLEPTAGIQPNFKIEDLDDDGKLEIIIWAGLWDFRIPGEDGKVEKTYEKQNDPHRYVVAIYKLIKEKYYLWNIYTSKNRYEPFFTWERPGLPE